MRFSARLNIPPSATVAINSLAQKKMSSGERVHNLSVGEPIIPTPSVIIDAATAAMHAGKTLYPPVAGIPELRHSAAAWMNETYATEYEAKNTIVTCGGKFGLFALLQALVESGDEVLIIAPYWVSYPSLVQLFGGVPKIIPTNPEDWKVTPKKIDQAIGGRTKIIILNNAANPTGVVYTKEEIASLLAMAARHNLIVISDEVYSGLVYDGSVYNSCGAFPEYTDRVIVVQSCSKHFAMTGWRVGFVFGSSEIISILTTLQGQSTTGTSSISQWAALAAITDARTIIPLVRGMVQARRDVFINYFAQWFGIRLPAPASALYCLIPLRALGVDDLRDEVFCQRALEEANIALVPGVAFGAPGYVRVSFGGKEDEISEALAALGKYLKS